MAAYDFDVTTSAKNTGHTVNLLNLFKKKIFKNYLNRNSLKYHRLNEFLCPVPWGR